MQLAKVVGINYSWILVCFIQQRKPYNETNFFEVGQLIIMQAMINISQKILKPAFDSENLKLFEDEVNRLFRTNEFNVIAHIKTFKVVQTMARVGKV